MSGSFYFLYDTERTVEIPVNSDGFFIKSALEDLSTIHTVTIVNEIHELLIKSWTIRFDSFDGVPELLHTESQMKWMSDWSTSVISDCPTASKGTLFETKTQAGHKGDDFIVRISGLENKRGKVVHQDNARYLAWYEAPRAGTYSLSGLAAEYFNNRWLFGAPVISRIDKIVDFHWSESDSITPTGKDFVSIR